MLFQYWDYVVAGSRMIDKFWIWKDLERNGCGLIRRFSNFIWTDNSHRDCSQDSQCAGWYSNQALPKYKCRALLLYLTCFVTLRCKECICNNRDHTQHLLQSWWVLFMTCLSDVLWVLKCAERVHTSDESLFHWTGWKICDKLSNNLPILWNVFDLWTFFTLKYKL
jgi:hypothetical protein